MTAIQVNTRYGQGVATTDHAASGYGLPVVVVDGTAYGPAEIGTVNLPTYGPEDEDVAAMHDALRRAGYTADA